MATEESDFDQFCRLFLDLKASCGGEARALSQVPLNTTVDDAAESLWDFMSQSKFGTAVVERPGRQHTHVPTDFRRLWKEFTALWELPLSAAGYDCFSRQELEDSGPISHEAPGLVLPDPDLSRVLFPFYHDLGAAYEAVAAARMHRAELAETHFSPQGVNDGWAAQLHEVIEVDIGMPLGDVLRRWQRLPTFFFEAELSTARSGELASASDVLRDACLSYVAGAHIAALAACRAAMEMIFKKIYFPEASNRKLQNVTQMARDAYPSLPWEKIDRVRRNANEALHDYQAGSARSPAYRNLVEEALSVVKNLIDNAPTK